MTECSICCEKFNKTYHSPINCATCTEDVVACQSCAKRYILDNDCDPTCMICKVEWDIEFVNKSFTKTFINKDLKKHRENVLYEKQLAKMPETQEYAHSLKMIEGLQQQWNILNVKKIEIQRTLTDLKRQQRDLEISINQIRWSGRNQEGKVNHFTFKCPIEGCTGFLNDKYICGICDNKICRHCMEIKTDDHECDEDKKQTVALIKKDTKPCPKCGQLIYKIDGCDQMWCPGCKTAFSWNTGRVETGTVHNPEYYRWMRESGQQLARNPGDEVYDPCRNVLPNYMQLLTQVRIYFPMIRDKNNRSIDSPQTVKISNIHRVIGHIEFARRQELADTNRTEMDQRDLRAQYLLKKIDKVILSKKLQIIEKRNKKTKKLLNIWNLLHIQLTEYIAKFMERYTSIEEGKYQIDRTLSDASKIRAYVNQAFKRVGLIFNVVYPGLTSDWIHVNNMEQYIKNKQKNAVNIVE